MIRRLIKKMQKVQLTYKFRLYPKPEHEEKLLETLELCRQTYNYFLGQWNGKENIPGRLELQSQLPKLKREKPELARVYSKVLQMVLYQLYSNLRALSQLKKKGKKVGRLRFKGKGWYKTFIYNQSGFKLIKTEKRLGILHLSKIGDIPIRVHRPVEGSIKQIIIKRHNSGKWFACICAEKEVEVKREEPMRVVGIDVGIRYFLTDTDRRQIENPRFCEKTLERIRVLQHWLSRRRRGSNYEKTRIKLAKAYERLVSQRDDFLHKLSRFYVKNYDVICVEDLQIKNMVRNHNLSQKILDASWGKFIRLLHEKAERATRVRVVKVPPKGTSEGLKYEDPLRDFISSNRIKMRGWGSPDPPAETEPLLVEIPTSSIIEAGSPQPSGVGSSPSHTT